MKLGAFSISLAVEDLEASRAFYAKLGFEVVGGDKKSYLIVQNEDATTIGLFQGMFEDNILTFNPGWTPRQELVEDFDDVRQIQRTLKERGLELKSEADETTTGPASFVLVDPDGNTILVDQHR
jgi:catechol 2,3-dioxygenase-like lactoylglutathione lyase family enzyme